MRGFLSHCVSCSSCGPPRASWVVGGIPALGPRLRWKPLSVPTLPGKPPPWQLPCHPLLGCGVGDAVTQGETLTHPPTGLYPLVCTPAGRGKKEERERVQKWAAPNILATQNVASSQTPLPGGTTQRSGHLPIISLEVIFSFLGNLPVSPSSLPSWLGRKELKGLVGQAARPKASSF